MKYSNKYTYLIEIAQRYALEPYDDGRKWFLCSTDLSVDLAAEAIIEGRLPALQLFFGSGQLKEFKNFKEIEGNSFECIFLENAYILKKHGN